MAKPHFEICRHCGSRNHTSIACHQLATRPGTAHDPAPPPDRLAERAARVRAALEQMGEHLARCDNQSGSRAAQVLASVPQNEAFLLLERLLNETA